MIAHDVRVGDVSGIVKGLGRHMMELCEVISSLRMVLISFKSWRCLPLAVYRTCLWIEAVTWRISRLMPFSTDTSIVMLSYLIQNPLRGIRTFIKIGPEAQHKQHNVRILDNSCKQDNDKILDKNYVRIFTSILSESWVILAMKTLTRFLTRIMSASWQTSCQNIDKNLVRILGNSCQQDTDNELDNNHVTILTRILSEY